MTGFVLPEKYSEDLVDENGAKMSKRYDGMRMGGGLFRERGNGNVADRRSGIGGAPATSHRRGFQLRASSPRSDHDPLTS
jgi:hypothetical protein